jgi:hypothetical protein
MEKWPGLSHVQRFVTRVAIKMAQYFGETEQYPSRYDRSWTLFGNASGLEIIVPFDGGDVASELRRRRAGVTDSSTRGGRKEQGQDENNRKARVYGKSYSKYVARWMRT